MKIRSVLRKILARVTGGQTVHNMPFGINISHDLSRRLPGYCMNTIFDVGANVGQSALAYASAFPCSKIYCFEPIKESYEQLCANAKGEGRIVCHNIALADIPGKGTMISKGISTMNCLVQYEEDGSLQAQDTEQVHVSTLDEFCKAADIDRISYLKVDTEGGDLNVLIGSRHMLKNQGIDIVEVEAGMNPGNKHHVPLESLKEFLEGYGYFIFGIYEQVAEWPTGEPHLRRTNTVFVSANMIRDHKSQRPA